MAAPAELVQGPAGHLRRQLPRFEQRALAMDPPPELVAAVVHVGPHDFSRSVYRNGAFDLYNYVMWSEPGRAPGEHRAAARDGTHDNGRPAAAPGARPAAGRGWFPRPARPRADLFERWLEHPQVTDPFWGPLQCGAALERVTVPVLLVGGWHDLFIEQTLEQYCTLAARGVPARLLVGPWAHLDLTSQGAVALTESLAWLDRYAGPGRTGSRPGPPDHPVRIWVGGEGAGEWREIGGWPPPGVAEQRWYRANGSLGTAEQAGAEQAGGSRARQDFVSAGGPAPARPGWSISRRWPASSMLEGLAALQALRHHHQARLHLARAGQGQVQVAERLRRHRAAHRGRPAQRDRPGEHAWRGAPVRPRAPDQAPGRRGAHPRFARNPGNGQVDATAADLVPTQYDIGLDAAHPSALLLPVTAPGR